MTATPASPNRRGAELVTTDGRSLPLVGANLRGDARGGIARLVLEQRFDNSYSEALHVTYKMPLPAHGAIAGYAFELDGRVITGSVDRKRAARERFEQAIASGHTAALLEQDRADIFTQELGNIPPRASIVARITIDMQLAWLTEGEWELRFPTVIGPHYVGAGATTEEVHATAIDVVDSPGIAARVSIELSIGDELAGIVSSPSHALERKPGNAISLATRGAALDRDIIVRWPVAAKAVGASLALARPEAGGDAYGLLTIVPPAPDAKMAALPRDLIVLLDTSGSMGGGPLDKAMRVIALLIESLGEADRLELIEFSSSARRYKAAPVLATAQAKQHAIAWVYGRTAGGSTEMHGAVLEALVAMRPDAQRQVVLVTDGYIGGEQQIVRLLVEGLPMSSRLHVVGVGSAPNRSLALAMSRAGRGAEILVGLDEDAERATRRLVDKTRAPVVTDVELSGSALLDGARSREPDVFAGAPIVSALRVSADGGVLVVRGKTARGPYHQVVTVPPCRAGSGNQGVAALYARERVADLEMKLAYMLEGASIATEIENVGLAFQIATRATSWIAVDTSRVVDGPSRREVMPQNLPYGTTAAAFGLRPVASVMMTATVERPSAGYAPQAFHAHATGSFAPQAYPSAGKTVFGGAPSEDAGELGEVFAQVAPSQPRARNEVHPVPSMAPRAAAAYRAKTRRANALAIAVLVLLFAVIAFLVWWLAL